MSHITEFSSIRIFLFFFTQQRQGGLVCAISSVSFMLACDDIPTFSSFLHRALREAVNVPHYIFLKRLLWKFTRTHLFDFFGC